MNTINTVGGRRHWRLPSKKIPEKQTKEGKKQKKKGKQENERNKKTKEN